MRNIKYGFINKMVLLVAAFAARTVFIRIMGAEYTGISSLYTNILSILNLVNMGFGSVLTYELYGPLCDHDEDAVRALVVLFRKIYLVVIAVVVAVGLLLIPFLPVIVNSELDTFHLYLYYFLYLADSACSYIAVHRRNVITADQKYYIVNTVDIACKFAQYVAQTIYLLMTHDFVGYLVISVLLTVIYNVVMNVIAGRMYPYLRTSSPVTVPTQTIERIKINVRATIIEKISNTVLNQTDSIIISMLLGTMAVGYYSNYNMIVYYLSTIIYSVIVVTIEASVGNLNAEGDHAKSYRTYKQLDFVMSFVNVFCVVEFACIIQDFIPIWIGDEYIQSYLLVAALMITFYLQQAMNLVSIYRKTLGLFDQVKRSYLAMAVLNIILSVVLGYAIGAPGVVVATGLSRLITTFWREGQVVYRRLGIPEWQYYLQQLRTAVVTVVTLLAALSICLLLDGMNIYAQIVLKSCVSLAVCVAIYFLLYHRSSEWTWVMQLIRGRIYRRK